MIILVWSMAIVTDALGQCPPNIGFEDGNFTNWETFYRKGSSTAKPNVPLEPSNPISTIHTIISKSSTQLDKYGGFPEVCPNGSGYSIKLGNEQVGGQASRVTYTYNIPKGREFKLILNYAVVLQNPTHELNQQPKFTAQVFNVTDGKYVDCPSFNFEASSSLPGFELSNVQIGGTRPTSVYFKKWAATTINLTSYQGKTVRLEFTAYDCVPGGHFGYAYLDIDSDCGSGITGNVYCRDQTSTTLLAPVGFANYTWYSADLKTQKGTGQALTLDPLPDPGTTYAVILEPYLGIGCTDTLYTSTQLYDDAFKVKALPIIYGCPDIGVDLTDASVTSGSSSALKFSYFTNPNTREYLYKPEAVTMDGTYYIKGENAYGCQAVVPVQVIITQPELTVKDGTTVVFPTTVDLGQTVKKLSGYTYTYYYDKEATSMINNYETISRSGTYWVKAANSGGCELIKPVTVIVKPPPPFVVSAPTAFTPNGDGINDRFTLKLEGEIAFGSVSVYDRNGSLVYRTNDKTAFWDGTYNGRTLPVGTYYWLFEGIDRYYKSKVNKGSYVSLLR